MFPAARPPLGWITGLALVVLAALGGLAACSPPRDNVIVVVCDTLRADHLGFHGYPRPTSPFLDSLAARSWVYANAYSHYSYTWPSISNLFTGLPYSRLVRRELFVTPGKGLESGGLAAGNHTLAELLAATGVPSAAVSANPYVNTRLGFGQGFSSFHDVYAWNPDFWNVALHKYTAEEVNAAAAAQIDRLEAAGGPWLLYLHYFDSHMPYLAPADDRALFEDSSYARTGRVVEGYFRDPKGDYLSYLTPELRSWVDSSDLAYLVAQYDAEIRHLDRGLRQLFADLTRRGLLARTTVVITADHGEAFMERGFWGHGFLSRSEEEHVPMIVIPAGRRGARPQRFTAVATTTDVFYSVLSHFGVPAPAEAARAWWAVDLFSGRKRREAAYTEGAWDTLAVRDGRFGFYRYTGLAAAELPLPVRDGQYLFDLRHDPAERRNLFATDPARATVLRDRLVLSAGREALASAGWGDPLKDGDEESKKRLEALGYQ